MVEDFEEGTCQDGEEVKVRTGTAREDFMSVGGILDESPE